MVIFWRLLIQCRPWIGLRRTLGPYIFIQSHVVFAPYLGCITVACVYVCGLLGHHVGR
jgi:hypothetical protein